LEVLWAAYSGQFSSRLKAAIKPYEKD